MINLFHINNHVINTDRYSNLLHDSVVTELEDTIAGYVGAKYAVALNSATNCLFLSILNKNVTVKIPSIMPPVVLNAIITSGNNYSFIDNVDWVGDSYIFHDFGEYKIIDSAQKLEKDQFINECNDDDLMIFSFYPTKPLGGSDGGLIVSNDIDKITYFREMSLNGMSYNVNNWDRDIKYPGYKMYMNSIQANIVLNNFKDGPISYSEKLNKLRNIREKYNKAFSKKNISNHLYRLQIDNRDQFITAMKNDNISCGIHYNALHLHSVYKQNDGICPLSEVHSLKTVSIPFHEKLTSDDTDLIISKVHEHSNI